MGTPFFSIFANHVAEATSIISKDTKTAALHLQTSMFHRHYATRMDESNLHIAATVRSFLKP